jgi:hypothetical protein
MVELQFFFKMSGDTQAAQGGGITGLRQWYSTLFVQVPPDIISVQLCSPRVVGV